jgi:hypothetical protein
MRDIIWAEDKRTQRNDYYWSLLLYNMLEKIIKENCNIYVKIHRRLFLTTKKYYIDWIRQVSFTVFNHFQFDTVLKRLR